jgi:hypothetical protein
MQGKRRRISSRLLFPQIFFTLFILVFIINITQESFNLSYAITTIAIVVMWIFLIYYCRSRPIIEYDFSSKILFIIDKKSGKTEVPVANIQKILFSAFGLSKSNSYQIIFIDNNLISRKVRLFPIFLHTDVEKLIRDTEAENSNVKIRT